MKTMRHLWGAGTANVVGLVSLAASGVLINALVARNYGSEGLGVFNQVFAIYIFASQLATLGCQFSVLRYVSEHFEDPRASRDILVSACLPAMAGAIGIAALLGLAFRFGGGRVYSHDVAEAVAYVLPGLLPFALNKVMLNALNGARSFGLFGILTTIRYAFMSAIATALAVMAAPLLCLGLIFSLSEALLFPILAAVCLHVFPAPRLAATRPWIARNVHFGLRSILGGMAVELNTRVDVLILGLFASDAAVGVYSFAAFFVEGLLQIPMLVRRFVDPSLTSLVVKGDKPPFADLVRRARSLNAALVVALNLLAVAFYARYAVLVGPEPLVAASEPLFFILSAGATVFGVYAVFSGILSQGGLPSAQTRYNLDFLFVNVLLNLCLAPLWGPTGSAIGTSLSFVAGALLLRRAVLRHLGIRI